jgi:hypothetical protein
MKLDLRRLVAACALAVTAIAVVAPGGSAGERSLDFTFEAVPGPGEVTYGENLAYRAEISNNSGSTQTHVIFRMGKPYTGSSTDPVPAAELIDSTCPVNDGKGVWVTYTDGTSEWTCDVGTLAATTDDTPQVTLSMVWRVLPSEATDDCPGCLKADARVTVKEGLNDETNPNDAFLPGNPQLPATLLAANSEASQNTDSAGGYETEACTDATGSGSLRTKQKLDGQNTVSTTVCIPTIPTDANNLGLATTLKEEIGQHPDDPGHAALGRSNVCVAALGENCPADAEHAQNFGTEDPLTLVFRIADDALPNGEKITVVYHNGNALPTCAASPTNADGCTVSIERSGGRVKIWTIVVRSPTNGFYNW